VNVGIRRVGIAVTALMLLLVAQLTYLQVVDAKTLAHDPRNGRDILKDLRAPRGTIISADDQILAISKPSHDVYKLQREYPQGALVSQVVGYQSLVIGTTGLEKTYNDVLTGNGGSKLGLRDVVDFFRGTKRVGNLKTSLRVDVQLVVKNALGEQKGSVVVIEPKTGEIVAMYSNPTFDPQPLAGHRADPVQQYFNLLKNAPDNPALPRAYREIYPPGSTFKVVTTTAALDTGVATLDRVFPTNQSLPIPQSDKPIANFGGHSCGGDLIAVFTASCNTAFARLGLDLGNQFPPAMRRFGIYDTPPLDIAPGSVASTGPAFDSFENNKPRFALAGIGQGDVFTTPLQMALIASAIADHGVIMRPHVATAVTDDQGRLSAPIKRSPWRRATSAATAATVRDLMIQVVEHGTGTAAKIPGITVAGKTGTAQTTPGENPHAWFVAFAPAEQPRYAIAVIVEHGGNQGGDATGGHLAAPIAQKILKYLLVPGTPP
jgi:Cell division protein FtsI/penicillin-binding protein 2